MDQPEEPEGTAPEPLPRADISTDISTDDSEQDDEQDDAERAAEHYIDDLRRRGEAVPEGEELPPGATHELVEGDGDEEPPTVRRRRYSIT